MAAKLARIARAAGWTLLSLTAVAGLLCAALFGAVHTGHLSTFHITSWSMSPTISAGDLVISKPTAAADVEVGDIVTVEADNSDGFVTHRVSGIEPGPTQDARVLELKGDANRDVDPHPVTVTSTHVEVVTVPKAANIISFVSTPPTSYFILLTLGALMVLTFVHQPSRGGQQAVDPGAPTAGEDWPADAPLESPFEQQGSSRGPSTRAVRDRQHLRS